jgi:DNA-directed RNA polymerase specialized sigma24 family protein
MKPRHYERLSKQARARWESQASSALTTDDKQVIRMLADRGFQHKRIAALFDVNQGRIVDALNDGAD